MFCKVVHTFFFKLLDLLSLGYVFKWEIFPHSPGPFVVTKRFKPLTFLEHFPIAQLLTARWNISNNITVSVPT